MIIQGKVWKFGDSINTDLLKPQFTRVRNMTDLEASKYVMHANRTSWAEKVEKGDLIVGGKNFGCGSSRLASGPIKALGISCILAESMSRIFFRNSISIGLPVMIAPGITHFCEEGDLVKINFSTGVINNYDSGKEFKVNSIPIDSPPIIILKEGGIWSLLEKEYKK